MNEIDWKEYERRKKLISKQNLPSEEYERAMKQLVEDLDSESDPVLVGRCSNQLTRNEFCSARIFDNEDYVTNETGQLICPKCAEGLLNAHTDDGTDTLGRAVIRKKKVVRRSAVSTLAVGIP